MTHGAATRKRSTLGETHMSATANTPAPAPAEEKIPRYIAVGVNEEQFKAIKAAANGKALSGFVLGIVADTLGTFKAETERAARTKYATEAEKKEAQTKARK